MQKVAFARSIRSKLAAAFIVVACFVAAFVGVAIAIYFQTVERAAQLEAEHVAQLIVDAVIERNRIRPNLQEYVTALTSLRKRDVVIVDVNQIGLADANPDEVGHKYDSDLGDAVGKTIGDSRTRTFIEKNELHPGGARQIVVPLRRDGWDSDQRSLGAVILEYTSIRDELFAAERRNLYLVTGAGVSVVLLVMFFGLRAARRIAQPIQDLKSSVDRIAAQDYGARVAVVSRDEIGLLGSAFNRMAEDLSVSHAELAEHQRALESRVEYLASYDPLTGLANRALLHEHLQQNLLRARARGGKLALVLVDIERFKAINDGLGRPAGDALLKEFGARMRGNSENGEVGRFEADHFAVIVPEMRSEDQLARRIERRAREVCDPPFVVADAEIRIAVKYGIAIFPDDGADADTLLRNAEAALKNAKERGVRYLFYTQAMNERVADKLSMENRLRQALDNGGFVLYYQPKVDVGSGKLAGVEALIRWNDPCTGLVAPEHFIPILEETGLSNDVGGWALRQAIADHLRWRAAGLPAVRIAVNVSPPQLRDRGFVGEIRRAIGVAPQAAAGLELEITESLIMEDVQHSIASLQAIRALGVTVAIDDFGTGFSSLSYLAKLPVDALKIDRSFIAEMTAKPEGLALVSTFINLAHSLTLKVIAEGVEAEEQARLLHLLRCDQMQGFLVSAPVPADVFEKNFLAPPAAAESALVTSPRFMKEPAERLLVP